MGYLMRAQQSISNAGCHFLSPSSATTPAGLIGVSVSGLEVSSLA